MKIIISFFLACAFLSAGENTRYAREILKTLCAPEMHGRGYYEKGDEKAAIYLGKELKKLGVKPFGDDHMQRFTISANCVSGRLEFTVNGTKLVPGADYIVDPATPPFDDGTETVYLDKEELIGADLRKKALSAYSGKTIVIDKASFGLLSADEDKRLKEAIDIFRFSEETDMEAIVMITSDNLVYSASQKQAERPLVTVRKEALAGKRIESCRLLIESELTGDYATQNIIGYIEGEIKDTFLCISAHYDHIGRMGHDAYFPGASDNASGTSMVLNLARHYTRHKPKYSIAVFLFSAEEIGILGSGHYVENPAFPLENIKFLLNLDLMGTGDDGITVVNGLQHKEKFDLLTALNDDGDYLKEIKIRGETCNSDHCPFHKKGVKSFFFYTMGGISHYHNIYDKEETLPLTEYEDLFILITRFLDSF